MTSGDDVRDARIHQSLNLVLEHQFLPLEAGKLELITGRLRGKKANLIIEVAMFGLERRKQLNRIVVVHLPPSLPHTRGRRKRPLFTASSISPWPRREKGQDKRPISWFITRR